MDAIKLLKDDHKTVRELLKRLTASKIINEELFKKIKKELTIHTKIEEEIFYPAFKNAVNTQEGRELFYEAHEEQELVDYLISKMGGEKNQDVFSAKAKILKELVGHHAHEEESEMFPKARKAMGKDQLLDLGWKMSERKAELQEERKLFPGLKIE